MADVRSPIPMHGLSWEIMCVLLRMRVMCSEIAGNGVTKIGSEVTQAIRGTTGVTQAYTIITERRLKW